MKDKTVLSILEVGIDTEVHLAQITIASSDSLAVVLDSIKTLIDEVGTFDAGTVTAHAIAELYRTATFIVRVVDPEEFIDYGQHVVVRVTENGYWIELFDPDHDGDVIAKR